MAESPAPGSFDGVIAVTAGADESLAGMSLFERAAFTLARAGARRLLCLGPRPTRKPRLPSTPVVWEDEALTWGRDMAATVVVTDATTVTHPGTIAALAADTSTGALVASAPGTLWRADGAVLDARLAGSTPTFALDPPPDARPWTPPPDALVADARTPEGRTHAERELYRRLGRGGDGWFTRVVDRRFSGAITRCILPTGISPNQVTIVSIAIGIAGGWCFARGSSGAAMAGALLFLLSTIVDGCDGEIARLTFRESPLGARLDILGDNLVHFFLFGGIAIGLYRRSADPVVATLGVALLAGVGLAMATVYLCIIRRAPNPAQQRFFEAFASREFAYLLVVLTLAGRLDWFLWLSALGTYAFAFGIVVLERRSPG